MNEELEATMAVERRKAYNSLVAQVKENIQRVWDALDVIFPEMKNHDVMDDLQAPPRFVKRKRKYKTTAIENSEKKIGGRPLGTKKCSKCGGMTPQVDQIKTEDGAIVCGRCG